MGFGSGSLLQQLLDPALLVDRRHRLVATRLPTAAVLGSMALNLKSKTDGRAIAVSHSAQPDEVHGSQLVTWKNRQKGPRDH